MNQPTTEGRSREDADGKRHRVHAGSCQYCGCPVQHASDDWELVWEAGRRVDARCTHRRCVCHRSPILGDHHGPHTHEWDDHAAFRGALYRFFTFLQLHAGDGD